MNGVHERGDCYINVKTLVNKKFELLFVLFEHYARKNQLLARV
jgi:hypothetical protein